jgi:hypothetical protein
MHDIPDEIKDACNPAMAIDESVRIGHSFRPNGKPCSDGKDARSLMVTRKTDGWYFYCFRCQYQGFISDSSGGETKVKNTLERIKRKTTRVVEEVKLPLDFIPMHTKPSDAHEEGVPWDAYHWLWDSGLDHQDIAQYNIGWSSYYQRVIIPCYDVALMEPSGDEARKLMGWTGREVAYSSKKTRAEAGVVKYLTKRAKGLKHVLFKAINPNSNVVVLVEDCLSAMKLRKLGGVNAIALLTTYIPVSLIFELKNCDVFIWLDGDMMAKSIKYVAKFRQLGVPVKFIHTPLDPKEYDQLSIYRFLKGGKK